MRSRASALGLLVALAAAPPAGATVTFGADLSRAPNANFDCTLFPTLIGFSATNLTSCTWSSTGPVSAPREGLLVPTGTGTITHVRVRVGPVTGPMRIVVLEAYRGATTGCCTGISASAPFTPTANTVTDVPVNLKVSSDPIGDPGTLTTTYDVLGLSILQAGVPVPVEDTGNHTDLNASAAFAFYPDVQPGQPVLPGSEFGYRLLVQADWEPLSGDPTPQVAQGPAVAPGQGAFPQQAVVPQPGAVPPGLTGVVPQLTGLAVPGLARILRAGGLDVNAVAPGPGRFALDAFLARALAKRLGIAALKPVRIGSGTARAPAGGRLSVPVRLTRRAKARLRHARSLRVTLKGTFTPTGGKPAAVSRTVTLKR